MRSDELGVPAVDLENKRAGDSDRSKIAEQLRIALDEGRLDLNEYDERLQQTYTAKTYAELDALVADIPGVAPVSKSQVAPVAPTPVVDHDAIRSKRRKRSRAREIKQIWSGFGGCAIFFTGIWALTWVVGGGSPPYYWPVWILGFWGIGALSATWAKLMRDLAARASDALPSRPALPIS